MRLPLPYRLLKAAPRCMKSLMREKGPAADLLSYVRREVHHHYWDNDDNCAVTTIQTAAPLFGIAVEQQVISSALGLHGAGGYGAQCGLVEGGLMMIGLLGSRSGESREQTIHLCRSYAAEFEEAFGSLLCRELRPEGFRPDNPPHLCEKLSVRAVCFTIGFLAGHWEMRQDPREVTGRPPDSAGTAASAPP